MLLGGEAPTQKLLRQATPQFLGSHRWESALWSPPGGVSSIPSLPSAWWKCWERAQGPGCPSHSCSPQGGHCTQSCPLQDRYNSSTFRWGPSKHWWLVEPSFTLFLRRLSLLSLLSSLSFTSYPAFSREMHFSLDPVSARVYSVFPFPKRCCNHFCPDLSHFQRCLLGFISIKSFGHWEVGLPHLAVAVSSVSDSMCAPVQGQWGGASPFGVSLGSYREMGSSASSVPPHRQPGVAGSHLWFQMIAL